MVSVAQQVLAELRNRGVELRARRGVIRFRPKMVMDSELIAKARACRAELIRLLAPSCPRPDRVMLDGRMCDVVWLDPIPTPPHCACWLCGARRWWRSRDGTAPWVCSACHPPIPRPDQIEWCSAPEDLRAGTRASLQPHSTSSGRLDQSGSVPGNAPSPINVFVHGKPSKRTSRVNCGAALFRMTPPPA